MSGAAAATSTQTAAPAAGESSSTEKVGGEVISHERMVEFLNKKRAERGEEPVEGAKPAKKESAADEKPADELKAKDAEGKADEPEAKAEDPRTKELEERVAHFEEREAKWSEVTDKLIVQRDHYKALYEQIREQLPQTGFEVDPSLEENAALRARLTEYQRAQERAALREQAEAERARATQIASYRDEITQTAQRLARSYPELDPKQNRELAEAFFRGWAGSGGDARDLEQKAMAFVQKVRGGRPQGAQQSTPRTLAGSKTPGRPLPVGRDWSDVRAWHRARFNNG